MSGQISKTPILTELSEVLSHVVNDRAQARARLHLLDWIGCAAAGAVEPAGQVLLKQMRPSASARAFVWGGLGNILEMDDVDKRALLHPGPSIIPAALAMAGEYDVSMSDLLTAIVRGYEATIRLGRAVGPAHYALWHSTGTCGAIGAAASSASLLSLDPDQTAHAMALAISQSAGLWYTRHEPSSMGKQLHTANAARAGMESAILARNGFQGPIGILEGPQGFFQAMCKDGNARDVLRNWSTDWLIHDVSFKPWPACRHAHAVIDAALQLRASDTFEADGEIVVRTYNDALKFCDKPDPKTVIEAKFSLQHCVAICLLRGEPSLEDFELAAINEPEVAALRTRVKVSVGDEYQERYPARFGAEVAAGRELIQVEDALGDPENPVTDLQLQEKALMLLTAGGASSADSRSVIKVTLDEETGARALIETITRVFS